MLRIQLLWLSEAIIHLNTVVEQTGGDMKNKKDKEGKKKEEERKYEAGGVDDGCWAGR